MRIIKLFLKEWWNLSPLECSKLEMKSETYTHTKRHNFVSVGEIMLCLFYYFCFLYCVCVYVCVWRGRSLTEPEAHYSGWAGLPISTEDHSDPSSEVLSLQAQTQAWFLVGYWEMNEIFIWENSLSHWAMSPDLCAMLRNGFNNSNWVGDTHTYAYTHMYAGGKISSSSMSNLTITNMTFSEDIAKYEGHQSYLCV